MFTSNDPEMIKLEESKIILLKSIRKNALNYLEGNLSILENFKESNSRPKEIIAKYRELFGETLRNSVTLQNLEKELHIYNLSLAKSLPPWELITKPTLQDEKVGPIRTTIFLEKLFYGLVLAFSICFIKNINENVIRDENLIKKIIRASLLEKLSTKSFDSWEEDIEMLIKGPLQDKEDGSIAVISLGDKNEYINKFNNVFLNKLDKRKYLQTQSIFDAKDYKYKILLIQKGVISKAELIKFVNKLYIQDIVLVGFVLLD